MPGENAVRWGLTPLQDQQIAGMLMWVPANLVFFGIATWLFALWISDSTPHKTSSQVIS
jgi:cytochrome c oxidase assembly factor CtaG